jgi:hypothetical protein
MEDNNPIEVEAAALRIAIAELAADPRFQRFMDHIQDRKDAFINDIGAPACFTNHAALSNISGRIDELTQILEMVQECRSQ